ncbi:MAG: HD domain-containing protein [Bdellovibrionaceae bacterium]|nr:HD domain-containing protein [Pseudobdellovibrionaceae bacterium]
MDHVSIRVSTLRGDQKINFDAYVKINDKFVLYLRRGDSFEGQRLKRLKEKKLKKMFILSGDESNYRQYLKTNIESAYDSTSSKDMESRAEIIQGEQQSNVEEVFEKPEDKAAYNETKDAAGKYVDFLMKNTQAATAVLNIENSDKNLAHHGVSVATFAISLAQKLNMTENKTTQILTLGALLHDIGHHDTTVNIAQPLKALTPQDLALYKEHPLKGAERVKDKNHFDQQVITIINEHEELLDGTGFPKGKKENQLDPLSIIVASCNAVDRLITFEGIAKNEAPKKLMIERVGMHPLNHIQLLSEVLKTLK